MCGYLRASGLLGLVVIAGTVGGGAPGIAPCAGPRAVLLAEAELRAYLGGECNNSQMMTVPCTNPNNDCVSTSITCEPVKSKTYCWRWAPNPQGSCMAMEGWNCSCTSESEGCATQYQGPRTGDSCPKGCNDARGTCGIVKTKCTSAPCGKD